MAYFTQVDTRFKGVFFVVVQKLILHCKGRKFTPVESKFQIIYKAAGM